MLGLFRIALPKRRGEKRGERKKKGEQKKRNAGLFCDFIFFKFLLFSESKTIEMQDFSATSFFQVFAFSYIKSIEKQDFSATSFLRLHFSSFCFFRY